MGMTGAMTLVASLLAAPVQLSLSPSAVRVGETAAVQLQWTAEAPAGAQFQWTASGGEIRESGPGAYAYVPPGIPCRAFVHLVVSTPEGPWAECAAPVQVYQQFVILKADDFALSSPVSFQRFADCLEELRRRGVKAAPGMIADGCVNPSPDLRTRVLGWHDSGLFEFFSHGYDHAYYLPGAAKALSAELSPVDGVNDTAYPPGTTYEFQGRPEAEQLDHLARAQQAILDTYGFRMRTFGAPFNKVDANTKRALETLGQVDVWFFGLAGTTLQNLHRGGGEIESNPGSPSLLTYLQTHDPAPPVVVLQQHPSQQSFWDRWGEYTAILDQIQMDGGTFILPGEYADLVRSGTLPLDPGAVITDPALECAVRMALGQWTGTIERSALAGLSSLQWSGQGSQIRSLAGIGACGALRQVDLRGNAITDVAPLVSLWRDMGGEMTVLLQDNPLSDGFTCEELPRLDEQGLHISASGPCDNVVFTLAVDGYGKVDPPDGEYLLPRGSTVTVRATPGRGWQFERWLGVPDGGSSGVLQVDLSTHRRITARFLGIPPDPDHEPGVPAGGVGGTAALALALAWAGATRMRSKSSAGPGKNKI